MRRIWFVLLVGCGRVGFESHAGGDDGGPFDGPLLQLEAGQCPTGYSFFGTSCYRLRQSPNLGWTDAEAACEADALGAHLVVPGNMAELIEIQTSVLPGVADAWIGISDRIVPGTHRAVTGQVAFTIWDTGEPDGGVDACVVMGASSPMLDKVCDDPNDFICEYDGVIADPAAF